MKKSIKFTINQLIIDDQPFNIDSFDRVISEDIDAGKLRNSETNEIEITSIKKVAKELQGDRFITLYFNYGDKFPYAPKVMKPDLNEYDNPRSPDEIEMREQFFVLIDKQTQRIYLSDQRKKKFLKTWLELKIIKPVVIKSIIKEDEFITKIKSLSSIYFSVVPNLMSSAQGSFLSESLVQDINGFDAERAKLELAYNKKGLTPNLIQKIKDIIANKLSFEEIVIIGRDENDFESVLNFDEVTSKLSVDVEIDTKSNMFECENVFSELIEILK